jgi:hypothetical protein
MNDEHLLFDELDDVFTEKNEIERTYKNGDV